MSNRGSDALYVMPTNDFPPENKNPNAREETEPPSKKIRRLSPSLDINKSLLKTQLCCKFLAGTCPYAASFCKFAHSVDELRSLPEESGRVHCKKFTSRQGCPYGEKCIFLHDERRGSFAIGLGPSAHNLKTRICNKWADTGYCPFGWNCRFAHGPSELHQSGGGHAAEGEGSALGTKQTGQLDRVTSHVSPSVPPQQTASVVTQNPSGVRTQRKWKGPNKISRIYGDWIDDIE